MEVAHESSHHSSIRLRSDRPLTLPALLGHRPARAVDLSAYLGNYRYNRSNEDTFEIVETRDGLGLETPGNFPRSLFHLGDNEFHPGGARSVRVRFSFEGDVASRVEIYDPELSIRALREQQARRAD